MAKEEHQRRSYKEELELMTKQITAVKKRKEVLEDFKALARARAEKKDARKAKAKAKSKAKRKAKWTAEAIARAARKETVQVESPVLDDEGADNYDLLLNDTEDDFLLGKDP